MVCCDTDRWKSWEHARWLTPENKPGSMSLWGEAADNPDRLSFDEKDHFSYAKHLTAEIEVEEPIRGVMVRRWRAKSDNNHWFDASYLCDVAAAMEGITVLGEGKAPESEQREKILAKGGWFAAQQAKQKRQSH